MKNLVIFASGAGSNAQKIIDHFRDSGLARISMIICNKRDAGVLQIAEREHIPSFLPDRYSFYHTQQIPDMLRDLRTDLIILAGFLWKIPDAIVDAYPGRIINIHPALLPKYGGKGMYGPHVHEAVIASGDSISGITIHYVNDKYDEGEMILQKTCPVNPGDTPQSLAQKVHRLEYKWYPETIEKILLQKKKL